MFHYTSRISSVKLAYQLSIANESWSARWKFLPMIRAINFMRGEWNNSAGAASHAWIPHALSADVRDTATKQPVIMAVCHSRGQLFEIL